jgi:hypothetical protein
MYCYYCTPCCDNTDTQVSPTIRDPLSVVKSVFTLHCSLTNEMLSAIYHKRTDRLLFV